MLMRLSILQGAGRLAAVLALPLLILTSCSSDESMASKSDGLEQLTFNVCTEGYGGATRGTPMNSVSGTAGVIGFEFYGEWDQADQDATEKTYLMYNDVLQGSGEIWKTSKAYFPDQTKKKRFYAYYPYQKSIDKYKDMLYFNDGTADEDALAPTFVYTSPAKASDQKDLMYAVSADVEYEEVNGEKVLQPIELTFHHLLAALKITVNNGFDNGTIKKVTISRVLKRGEFAFELGYWDYIPDDEFVTIEQEVEVKVNTKNTNELPLTSETQYFMLLPQELNQTSVLTIYYNNGSMEEDLQITYDLGKKWITVGDNQQHLTFTQGKITTLNITIESVTKMSVKCTVTDWGTGAVFGGSDATVLPVEMEGLLHDWEDYPGTNTSGSTEVDVITGPQS